MGHARSSETVSSTWLKEKQRNFLSKHLVVVLILMTLTNATDSVEDYGYQLTMLNPPTHSLAFRLPNRLRCLGERRELHIGCPGGALAENGFQCSLSVTECISLRCLS